MLVDAAGIDLDAVLTRVSPPQAQRWSVELRLFSACI
jgi:hypothetical protein